VITHYHSDHVGGVVQLADRVRVGAFVDHGANLEDAEQTRTNYANYEAVVAKTGARHIVVKPGDKVPIEGLDVEVLTAARGHIANPLSGAG